jgi:hypothetical protein
VTDLSFILSVLYVQMWDMNLESCHCLQVIVSVYWIENLQFLCIGYCFFFLFLFIYLFFIHMCIQAWVISPSCSDLWICSFNPSSQYLRIACYWYLSWDARTIFNGLSPVLTKQPTASVAHSVPHVTELGFIPNLQSCLTCIHPTVSELLFYEQLH